MFGQVVDGHQFVLEIENQKVDASHRPYADVRISNCGELVLMKSKKFFIMLVYFFNVPLQEEKLLERRRPWFLFLLANQRVTPRVTNYLVAAVRRREDQGRNEGARKSQQRRVAKRRE